MAPRQRFVARHSIPFYAVMAAGGLVIGGLALYTGVTAPTADAEGRPISGVMLWAVVGVAILSLSYYIRRGVVRVLDRSPVVSIDEHGVALRIGKIWQIGWDKINKVELRGILLRARLEMQIDPEIHAAMRLPSLLSDDNFTSVKQKPFTIGIGSQGLDRKLSDALASIRAWRPHLVKR